MVGPKYMSSLGMKSVQFDGCTFDFEIDGKRPKRQWVVKTTNNRIGKELESKKCRHGKGFYDQFEGALTKKSGFYNMNMVICLVLTLFPHVISWTKSLHFQCHRFALTPIGLGCKIIILLRCALWLQFINC